MYKPFPGSDSCARTSPGSKARERARERVKTYGMLFAAAAGVTAPSLTKADVFYYKGPDAGAWDSSAELYFSWFDATVPNNYNFPPDGATVNLLKSGTNGVTGFNIFYNYNYTTAGINSLTIDSGNTLQQNQANTLLRITGNEIVGNVAAGRLVQGNGTHFVNQMLVGALATGNGTVILSGGVMNVGLENSVGRNGRGTFTQYGGTNNVYQLTLGDFGTGSYTMSDGTLATSWIDVGIHGNGTFTQTGGSARVTGNLIIASVLGSTGRVTLGGGTLTADYISNDKGGTLEQAAGTLNFALFNHYNGATTIGTNANPMSLYVGGPTFANGTFHMLGGVLSVSDSEFVGSGAGTAGTYDQGGGTNTVNGGGIFFGYANGASGTGSLSGGKLWGTDEHVGYSGRGTFTQSGGVNSPVDLRVGSQSSGSGTFTLSGGVLTTFQTEAGALGTGVINQTGGTHTTSLLYVGGGVAGAYKLSGGILSVSEDAAVGYGSGNGTFSQNGGVANVGAFLLLGEIGGGATGAVGLSGGTLTANSIQVNYGNFDQTGGTLKFDSFTQILGTTTIGTGASPLSMFISSPTSNASLTLYSGNITVSDSEYFGSSAGQAGSYYQSGGNNAVNGPNGMIFGNSSGATGSGTMLGGVLNVATLEIIGNSGSGTFNQTGGSNSAQYVIMGYQPGSTGVMNLSDGWLRSTGNTIVGNNGAGSLFQTGGNHTANFLYVGVATNGLYSMSNGTLTVLSNAFLGYSAGANGTFNLSGGTATADNLNLGANGGIGHLNISGGSLNVANVIQASNASSTIQMDGGVLSAAAMVLPNWSQLALNSGVVNLNGGVSSNAGNLNIGNTQGSIATLNQSGDASVVDVSGNLTLGTKVLTGGNYNLSGGSLHTFHSLAGDLGTGHFIQSGGTHATAVLFLGNQSGSLGTYALSGGTLADQTAFIGLQGNGTFDQSGGTHTVSGDMFLANFGATATYTLSGSAMLNVAGIEAIGQGGTGTFNQSGGTHTISGVKGLSLASVTNSTGFFNLGGGTLNANNVTIGGYIGNAQGTRLAGGLGRFAVTGGNLNVADSIGVLTELSGTAVSGLTIGGGSVTSANEYIGYSGAGTYNQTGGTNIVNGSGVPAGIFFGYLNGASGTGTLSGGRLNVGYQEYIGYSGTGTFDQSGGSNSAVFVTMGWQPSGNGTMTLSGGTLDTGATYVGYLGNGKFFQSGGTHTTGGLYVGSAGSGVYSQSGGTLVVNGNANAGYGGTGSFNQSGGNVSVSNTFYVNNGGSTGTVNISGGAFSAGAVVNNGLFRQTGGVATVGPVTVNPGASATIGGGTHPAQFTFDGMTADNLTVTTNGTARQKVVGGPIPAGRDNSATNTIGALTISGTNGVLDIGNTDLRLDNNRTPYAQSRAAWASGYNNDPGAGYGTWNGSKGMTSSVAQASAQVDGKVTIGYLDGAAQSDFGASYADLIKGPVMGKGETLYRPTLMGDLNLDGFTDGDDIGIIISLGYFGSGIAPHGWLDGDLNGDGSVDGNDIGLIISTGSYNAAPYKAAKAAATVSGSSVAANTIEGHFGDGKFDFIYDPATGDIKIAYDGDPNITGGKPLQRLKLASLGGRFITSALNTSGFGTATNTNTLLDCGQAQGSIPDHYDLGNVLPAGLDTQTLLNDLTLNWQVLNGGLGVRNGDLVVGVPEPTVLGLIGVGAIGLLSRRRRAGASQARQKREPL